MDCRSATISLVIPTYNRGHLIAETFGSVLAPDPPLLEIIVVDDDWTDNTTAVMASYAGRVQLLGGLNGVDDLPEAGYVGTIQD